MTTQQIELELMTLPPIMRFQIAQRLMSSLDVSELIAEPEASVEENPLLSIAGMFSGGPGDLAERVNDVVAEEIDKKYRLEK